MAHDLLPDVDCNDVVEGFKIETREKPAPKAKSAGKKRDGSVGGGKGRSPKKAKESPGKGKANTPTPSYVGAKIAKYFDGEAYHGTVTCRRGKWWHVVYEDGDEEDLNPDDIPAGCDLFNELASVKGWLR